MSLALHRQATTTEFLNKTEKGRKNILPPFFVAGIPDELSGQPSGRTEFSA
jgi:hypothetical protein